MHNSRKTKYQELLNDKRWKDLSTRVKERDGNKCVLCDNTNNIQAHHKKYVGKPWESPLEDLITLCSVCHAKHHGKDNGISTKRIKRKTKIRKVKQPIERVAECVEKLKKYKLYEGKNYTVKNNALIFKPKKCNGRKIKFTYYPSSNKYMALSKWFKCGGLEEFVNLYKFDYSELLNYSGSYCR